MKRMVIVGTVAKSLYYKDAREKLRVYRLDTKAVKDINNDDLAPVADKLGLMNYADLQIPEVRNLYPCYYQGGATKLLDGGDACYVLGTFGDGGYVCIRPHLATDYIQVIPRSRLVSEVKKGTMVLLNAVIEQGEKADFISPIIGGVWSDMSYLKGRKLVDVVENSGEYGSDCDHAHEHTYDVRDRIGAEESVDNHDELGMLLPEQKEFLKDYYIAYSIDTFNKMVQKSRWTLKNEHEIKEKNKKRLQSKIARIAELRTQSEGADWCFAGLWDVGVVSSRPEHKCEFGHSLRYIYRARPVNLSIVEAEKKGLLLQFGIVCHADFLDIPKDEVKRLTKLLDTMSSEIRFISMVIANNTLQKHTDLMASMYDVLGRLQNNDKLVDVLGDRLAKAYQGFVTNQIPLVESFVIDVMGCLEKYGVQKVLSAAGFDTSMFAKNPTGLYTLPMLDVKATKSEIQNYARVLNYKHNTGMSSLYRTQEDYPTVLTTYATMLIRNDIAGEYMYNPLHTITDFVKGNSTTYQRYGADEVLKEYPSEMKKYIYGYNESTRELRNRWMTYFEKNSYAVEYLTAMSGAKVKCLTTHGLETIITLAKRLTATGKHIEKVIGCKNTQVMMKELVDTISYNYQKIEKKYKDVHPLLLLMSIPFTVSIGNDAACRRIGYTRLANKVDDINSFLLARLDETKDGTDTEYVAKLQELFAPEPQEAVESSVTVAVTKEFGVDSLDFLTAANRNKLEQFMKEVVATVSSCDAIMGKVADDTPVDTLCTADKVVTLNFNSMIQLLEDYDDLFDAYSKNATMQSIKDTAYEQMYAIKNQMRQLDARIQEMRRLEREKKDTPVQNGVSKSRKSGSVAKSSQESSANANRGEGDAAVESKKLADDFTALYNKLHNEVAGDSSVHIALDIIKRFRTKFKEKQGFTSREQYRVTQELAKLKRIEAEQNNM